MTEEQTAVLSAMAGARSLTCGEISQIAGMPSETVWFALAQLERAGAVQRLTNSPGKPTNWVRADLLEEADMKPLNLLDLFSGIGGFSLGLERSGLCKTVAFCEIEPFPRRVLAKHWPEVPCYDNVRTLTAARLAADGITIDAICGGFPCQDISTAGKGAGLAGERSGLWSEIARLAGKLRPRIVIVENVAALLSRELGTVLGDLASIGYDAEWHCIPASYVGAPHRRDRVWIIAYPCVHGRSGAQADAQHTNTNSLRPHRGGVHVNRSTQSRDEQVSLIGSLGEVLAYPARKRWSEAGQHSQRSAQWFACGGEILANAIRIGRDQIVASVISRQESQGTAGQADHCCSAGGGQWWLTEPDVGRVAHEVPDRVDRLKGLGNAVVPQIPELIGRAILECAS